MRHNTLQRIQRTLAIIGFIALAGIVLIAARVAGFGIPGVDGLAPQGVRWGAFNRSVAIVSGHAGFDSGAICTDAAGQVTLAEVDVNAGVANLVAQRLRRAGTDVLILDEYDPRLRDLEAEVLVSIHADSCIDASGYKAAGHDESDTPAADARLLACIDTIYPAVTNLPHHPNTVTHNMTGYHVFNRIAPTTPAAILELGFLGGDQIVLTEEQPLLAKAIADSILCFLDGEAELAGQETEP